MQNKVSWLFRVIISLERLKKNSVTEESMGKSNREFLLNLPKFVLAIGSIESRDRHLVKARSLNYYGRCPSLKLSTLILGRQRS